MTLQTEQARHAEQYAPAMDALLRWPRWQIQLADLDGELCDPEARLFVISPAPTAQRAVAHAVAHLDLGHHLKSGGFDDDDCDAADRLARGRLAQPQACVPRPAPTRRPRLLQRRALWLLALLLIGLELLALAAHPA